MVRVRAFAVAVACVVTVLSAGRAGAGPATDQLRGAVDRVLKIVEDPSLKGDGRTTERRAAVRQVAQEIFDFQEMARRSLGRHWQTLNEKQREEFTALFSDLLERSYVSRIEQYGGERISYVNERVDGDTAGVLTKITTKGGTEVPIEYRTLKKGDRWFVYDVLIEGVSLVSNYRTQFNKILQTSNYNDLIQRLRAKQDDLEGTAKKPAPKKP